MTTLTQRQILAFGEAAESMPTAPLAAAVKKLIVERQLLISTMMAAAVEIDEHWAAHCDKEGYGPTNLLRRLESGVASDYGYTLNEYKGLQNIVQEQEALLRTADAVVNKILDEDHDANDAIESVVRLKMTFVAKGYGVKEVRQ